MHAGGHWARNCWATARFRPSVQVIAQIWVLLLAGVGVAAGLDYAAGHWFDGFSGVFLGPVQIPPIVANALFGAFVAYIYSAPPLKLKQSGMRWGWGTREVPLMPWAMGIERPKWAVLLTTGTCLTKDRPFRTTIWAGR